MNEAQQALLTILQAHQPVDDLEGRYVERIREVVLKSDRPLHRETLPGHITGSALVFDPAQRKVLLHYHRFLDAWLQFGGHSDDEIDPARVALRETMEESGLTDLTFFPDDAVPRPVDIDIHEIPESEKMPAHLHLDFRYLLATRETTPPGGGVGESNQFRWLNLDELVRGEIAIKTDIHRLLAKLQRLLDGRTPNTAP